MQNQKKSSKKIVLTSNIIFDNIDIQITYTPFYFRVGLVSHIEILSNQPNPISETGYRSAWLIGKEYDEHFNFVELVKQDLLTFSKKREWVEFLKQQKRKTLANSQLSLF